ncbi:gamma-glutamyltransferase [Alkalihalophilus lindianensis]|uniref:Gamma-glutamyltransferase n=1 Tax=Alkalihalophilus lindianensis TaxID=1630542 RepID=A0ABU3X8J1_9BACI|nr:gamma-glutamyltransferase [Alkalihalophilus lindianensis]MDV2684195.1 gamma-glutamyltransferase [Alkalihalophilus lindianensis]
MFIKKLSILLIINSLVLGSVIPLNTASAEEQGLNKESKYDNYGVSASHPAAVEAGMEVLENGGNAVDAAIAVSYALGVVEPYGSGIGGGGQMLILPPDKEEPVVYDYRASATSDEEWNQQVSGVPGIVRGLAIIHEDFGLTPMEHLISPAVSLAEEGFEVDYLLWERLEAASPRLPVEELPHFFPDGKTIEPGKTLKQPELAETLTAIQEDGPRAFYAGEIGGKLTETIPYLDAEELATYEVEITEAVKGELESGTLYSASAPLAGVSVVQSMLLAEELNIAETKENEFEFVHIMNEISKITKNERITKVGDPEFTDVDVDVLTNDEHIKELAGQVSLSEPSKETIFDEEREHDEKTDTTHFVVVDPDGMVVSATDTLSNFFGSGEYTSGFFLNNSTEQFSEFGDSPNKYEPNKRSRSLSAPTIYVDDERVIGIGTPGGNRIPSVMAQVLSRHLYFGEPLENAVEAKRFYGEDDVLYVEEGYSEEVLGDMARAGYQFENKRLAVYFGGIQALELNKADGTINGIADMRRSGLWDAKDLFKWNEFFENLFFVFFILGIIFPSLHLLHSLPWFRSKEESIKKKLEEEKGISVLVPCYNEQGIIETSLKNMSSLPYKNVEVIYINDGSNDQTFSLLHTYLKLKPSNKAPLKKLSHKSVKNFYQSELYPFIYVVDKVNGGKADALNAGIEYASEDIVVSLDADTVLTENALPKVNETFEDEDVVAAGGMVHVLQTKTSNPLKRLSLRHANFLVRLQMFDFLKAFYITKVSLARFHALAVISGAFGIFRKEALLEVGGYRSTIGEDIDITLKMHEYIAKHISKKVVHIKDAISYTEMPETWNDFFKQRVRWQKAYIDCVIHFHSFFRKTLFRKAVSFFYIFESFLVGIISAFIMTGFFIVNAIVSPPESYLSYMLYYLTFLFIFGVVYDIAALIMNRYHGFRFQWRDIPSLCITILLDVFVYRFALMYIVMHGTIEYFFNTDWNKVSRTGRNYQTETKPDTSPAA